MGGVELRLLFWNMRRQAQPAACVADLWAEHEPHVLVTAETPDELASVLLQRTPSLRNFSVGDRVGVFSPAVGTSLNPVLAGRYGEALELTLPESPTHLLVAVHIESPLWQPSSDDQGLAAENVRKFIEDAEEKIGHDRTIVVGDFNMDPFTPAMVDFRGLNAMSTRRLTQRGPRTLGGITRKTFTIRCGACSVTARSRRAATTSGGPARAATIGISSTRCCFAVAS